MLRTLGRAILQPLVAALALGWAGAADAAGTREVVDLAGRTVAVPETVERVILGEGRYIPTLAILDRDDPVKRVAGVLGEWQRLDPAGHGRYLARFPDLAGIPLIGRASADSFSLEKAIALQPDVAIFGIEGHGPSAAASDVIARLEAAGIAVVFIDFRPQPLENTRRSVELLGRVLGREREAAAFLEVYDRELAVVSGRLAGLARKPSVFLESRVGLHDQCCETMGRGMMGRFVEFSGGDNVATGLVPGVVGTVNVEHLLAVQPEIYVGTATGALATADKTPNRIVLGAGVPPEAARASLERALGRRGVAELEAVRQGRAFAIWHHFYNSPFHVAALQAMAKWFHPDLFADIDPEATLRMLYDRFQPVPLDGTYWIGLR